MKKIGSLMMQTYKERVEQVVLDSQSVFYIFKKMIGQEYGSRGEQNIEPKYYKNKKLFVAAKSSLWMGELQLNRQYLIEKLNTELGIEAVVDMKIESYFN